jgi:hypothetical protein
MKQFDTIDETLAYVTSEDATNTDARHLTAGSRNMLIDETRKVVTRKGNTLFGAGNSALIPVRQGVTWNNSTAGELSLRVYDDEMEVYLSEVDGVEVNAWTRLANGWNTTIKPRFTTWYSDSDVLDFLLFVFGDDNIYAWSGCVAAVESVTGTTITKAGATTWAEARALTTGSKILVNTRTGTEYTYTGGEATDTLTGIADTTGIIPGDILVQKIVTTTDKPEANRPNHTIFTYENQICVGSDEDNVVYVSKNTTYSNFTYSSPRVPGEGALFTLDDPVRGFGELESSLIIFAGRSSIYQAKPREITVGTTLAETFEVEKFQTGIGQSAQNQEVIQQIGNTLVYLSYEPALREIPSPSLLLAGQEPRTLSNPIKPDFDAEDWTNAAAFWYKNAYYLTAPTNRRVYILQFRQDADGRLRRFWQPPQTMAISSFVAIGDLLYGHSAVVAESYRLFNPIAYSDENSSGAKQAIYHVAKFAYRNYKNRVALKTFDEYFIEGEIGGSTKILQTLYYDFGGATQKIEHIIDGADMDILLESLINTSLAQQPLGQQPLGGSVDAPADAAKFRVIFEQAREDFVEMQDTYETDTVDQYWSIISRGANAQLSRRQNISIKK